MKVQLLVSALDDHGLTFAQFSALGSIIALALISVAAAAPSGANPVHHDTHPNAPPPKPFHGPPSHGTHPWSPHAIAERRDTIPNAPDTAPARNDAPPKAPHSPPPPHAPPPPTSTHLPPPPASAHPTPHDATPDHHDWDAPPEDVRTNYLVVDLISNAIPGLIAMK